MPIPVKLTQNTPPSTTAPPGERPEECRICSQQRFRLHMHHRLLLSGARLPSPGVYLAALMGALKVSQSLSLAQSFQSLAAFTIPGCDLDFESMFESSSSIFSLLLIFIL